MPQPSPDDTKPEPIEPTVAPSEQSAAIRHIQTTVQMSGFSGPLPPPSVLRDYEVVVPGLAERLASAMFKEQDHRQAVERELIELEKKDSNRSYVITWAALSIPLILAVAVLVAVSRSDGDGAMWASIVGVVYAVGSITSALVKGKRLNRDEGGEAEERNADSTRKSRSN